MKFIKLLLVLTILTVSSAMAQDSMDYSDTMYNDPFIEETMMEDGVAIQDEIATVERTTREEFVSLLTQFISSGILAFILCLMFPKFFKKTSKILTSRNKFRIMFEALKVLFVLFVLSLVGIGLLIGFFPGAIGLLTVLGLYFLGLPVFSIGLLEWIFAKRSIKFATLTRTNKLISLISVNLIIMLVILPFALLIPEYRIITNQVEMDLDIISNIAMLIMTLLGTGMFVIHVKELLVKHKSKL